MNARTYFGSLPTQRLCVMGLGALALCSCDGRPRDAGSDARAQGQDVSTPRDKLQGQDAASSPDGSEQPACGQCTNPPSSRCVSAQTFRSYPQLGECQGGHCMYQHVDVTCSGGCENETCHDCVPEWTDVTSCQCALEQCGQGCTGHKTQFDGCAEHREVACQKPATPCHSVFVEAEHFTHPGGWKLDGQFVDVMGSAYLLAHGMGKPVADATTTVSFPKTGTYRLWVRTKDWVAPHSPGKFKIAVGSTTLATNFGTNGADWSWQDGGTVQVTATSTTLRLIDQSGFDGRCDALFFSSDLAFIPPNASTALAAWRREQLGLPDKLPLAGSFDLVVVGGGIAGTSAAVAAARLGLSVALIQDRPVLGGNASQEIRVPTASILSGNIVEELNTDHTCLYDVLGMDWLVQNDVARHAVVEGEPDIHLYLLHRATGVVMSKGKIDSVIAKNLTTGADYRFAAPLFVDSTGDGWVGFWAGADFRMGREARSEFDEVWAPQNADKQTLGNSVMFMSEDTKSPTAFPDVSAWTRDVVGKWMAVRGDWSWEYGGLRAKLHTIYDAEHIRDHLLRAIYGAFHNAHTKSEFSTYRLTWVGYVAGKRESRRLIGDVLLTEQDIVDHTHFDDVVFTGNNFIDLHSVAPSQCRNCQSRWECRKGRERHCDYLWEVPTKPCPCDGLAALQTSCDFRSGAYTGQPPGVPFQLVHNFEVPYRSLYSRNVPNLFMAGRDISATHVAFGATRLMNTCGQMGVAVGTAAALCRQYGTNPRGLYQGRYVPALQQAIRNWPALLLDNDDDSGIAVTGDWPKSAVGSDHFGPSYLKNDNAKKGAKSVSFTPELAPYFADYRVYLTWSAGPDRATNVPVAIKHAMGSDSKTVNQRQNGGQWMSIGSYPFVQGTGGYVEIVPNDSTDGHVVADAVKFFPKDIIVDNAHPQGVTQSGSWTENNATSGHYGPNYLHDGATGKGQNKSVTFAPSLPFYAHYGVYLRWSADYNRAASVPVDIVHHQGTATVHVDQRTNGGQWVLVGVYPFRSGNAGHITIRNDGANGHVIADAVKLTPVIVMDNREANGVRFTPPHKRFWTYSTAHHGQYWVSDYVHDQNRDKGKKSVHFTPLVPFSGSYKVYFRWTDGSNRAPKVPIDIIHAGGKTTRTVDQRTNGGKWNPLGTFNFAQGTSGGVHVRTTGTTGHVVIDAVMFEPV